MKIVLDWQVSSFFGWGVYGLNMALEFSKRPDVEAMSSQPIVRQQVVLDALRWKAIAPFVERTDGFPLRKDTDLVHIHALGNVPAYRTSPRIGVIFFEQPLDADYVEWLKRYDIIITGSTWNEEVLRSHGLSNVRTLIQGVDRSLFHPAPRRNLYPGRFLIFSGGKAEPRKGQDIVVRAFRIFARKHPEAMLVTAWHSPWPHLAKGMDLDLSEFADRVIDMGPVPNVWMAPVYRECHVGLFPNRCEGGTNLVAMEAIACGLPVIVSDCTGHRDLVHLAPWSEGLKPASDGEVRLDAVIHLLERAFDGEIGKASAHSLPEWSETADGLLAAAREVSSS